MDSLEVLGSKPRLELLRLLSRRDMYVSELMEKVGMDGKTATHHLDVLTEAGLLDSYKDGRRRYYVGSGDPCRDNAVTESSIRRPVPRSQEFRIARHI